MNALLTKAIEAASKLPDDDQTALAEVILDRVEGESRWDAAFADPRSAALLKRLSQEAAGDIAGGLAIDGDPSTIVR